MIIGRAMDADFIMPDKRCSRQHLHVSRSAEQVTVQDMNSRHGTLLNKKLLAEPAVLERGDEILIGHTMLLFCDDDFNSAGVIKDLAEREEEVISTVRRHKHHLDDEPGEGEKREHVREKKIVTRRRKSGGATHNFGISVKTVRLLQRSFMVFCVPLFGLAVYALIFGSYHPAVRAASAAVLLAIMAYARWLQKV